jgi:hypothetical protein
MPPRSASPCFGCKTIAQSVRQETAALRNFDPAYVSNGSMALKKSKLRRFPAFWQLS